MGKKSSILGGKVEEKERLRRIRTTEVEEELGGRHRGGLHKPDIFEINAGSGVIFKAAGRRDGV